MQTARVAVVKDGQRSSDLKRCPRNNRLAVRAPLTGADPSPGCWSIQASAALEAFSPQRSSGSPGQLVGALFSQDQYDELTAGKNLGPPRVLRSAGAGLGLTTTTVPPFPSFLGVGVAGGAGAGAGFGPRRLRRGGAGAGLWPSWLYVTGRLWTSRLRRGRLSGTLLPSPLGSNLDHLRAIRWLD